MIEIKYVCSNGEEYNLIGDKMKATSGYFHEYEWKPNATEREMGATVNAFTKEPVIYDISMKKPIGRKIWTISEGKEKVEYKLKGEV